MKSARPFHISSRWTLFVLAIAFVSCGGKTGSSAPPTSSLADAMASIDSAKSLMIRDLSVVNDTSYTQYSSNTDDHIGAWSFGRLMTEMAGPLDPSDFVLTWLRRWESAQSVNGFVAAARPSVRTEIIDPWRIASQCPAGNSPCTLDFTKAPFRLLAIAYRPDLRTATVHNPGTAGEGRFVFGLLGSNGVRKQFTVIFEYGLPAREWSDVLNWAKRWAELSGMPFGSDFNQALAEITNSFSKRNADPSKPNGSALDQLRTNDFALSQADGDNPTLWELRQFNLSSQSHYLVQSTVVNTPDISFNNSQSLADYLTNNAASIMAGTGRVDANMLGASAPNRGVFNPTLGAVQNPLVWAAPGVDNQVVRAFATRTCSGCHLSETGTIFTHVKPREPNVAAALSAFLTNTALPARVRDLAGLLSREDQDEEGSRHSGQGD